MDRTKPVEIPENEEQLWRDYSAIKFLKAYGENEPEYSEADIIEANPDYKQTVLTDKPRP